MKINSAALEKIRRICLSLNLIKKNEHIYFSKLTGGVSSDIWKVNTNSKVFCIKSSLENLKVDKKWVVPKCRNQIEVKYYNEAKKYIPHSIPQILAHNKEANIFAMKWYNPSTYKNWKSELLKENIYSNKATHLAFIISKMHNETSSKQEYSSLFSNQKIFDAIRIEPYFYYLAKKYKDFSQIIMDQTKSLINNKKVLVHGDISPKNILLSPKRTIIIDAECACWGDPAFDIAFFINHFLLKSLLLKNITNELINLAISFMNNYLKLVKWEDPKKLEKRIVKLLPIFLLARVDGKSPVEYLNCKQKNITRDFSLNMLNEKKYKFLDFINVWRNHLE